MEIARAKRYSPEGWKYVNKDGTLWPKDEWIRYSAKHPKPLTAVMQAQDDPDLLKNKALPPWDVLPDPSAPRTKIPMYQWEGKEDGHAEWLAMIRFVKPLQRGPAPTPGVQTKVTDYFPK